MITLRSARPGDRFAIHALTQAAFGRAAEADLNDRLRSAGRAVVELVAEDEGRVVGHVMFSPVAFEGARGVALGPICVDEAFRGRGVMRRLVEAGLDAVRGDGDFAMLLGSPALYPRFGFVPAGRFGMRCYEDVPEDVFMVIELRPGTLAGRSGMAAFAPEFREVG